MGLLTCCALCTYAQDPAKLSKAVKARNVIHQAFVNRKVSAILAKRVDRSYANAAHLETTLREKMPLANLFPRQAAKELTFPLNAQLTSEFYPHLQEILRTDKQLSRYFVAQNNRATLKFMPKQTASLMLMQQSIDHLKKRQLIPTQPAREDMNWLAQQIPLDTQYLLLGEIHDVPQIHQQMARLIPLLQQRFGKRRIVWLTEFLPHTYSVEDAVRNNIPAQLIHLWDTLQAHHIKVIGIEQLFAALLKAPSLRKTNHLYMWTTLEGIRLRNEFWEKQIAKFRARYPDSLIVIHAGIGHLDYTLANSLGISLHQKGPTFTVSFLPGYRIEHKSLLFTLYQEIPGYPLQFSSFLLKFLQDNPDMLPVEPDGFAPYSFFDVATLGHFPQRILQFGPKDWQITGFDVQIKIPINSPK